MLSDYLVIRVTAKPGESFLDRMIAMVEGAERKKTPNEIALTIVLAGFTLVFLMVCASLYPIARYFNVTIDVPTLIALLVCLIPTTIGALLSAIGIAGMARLSQANVMAMSGRAVEAAGDVDVLLLDKTGTITLGNRQASEFRAAPGVEEKDLADRAQLSSLSDETAEGRSIVVLAKTRFNIRGRDMEHAHAEFVPFSARTRMSGVNLGQRQIRKGSVDAILQFVTQQGGSLPQGVRNDVDSISRAGGTPLVVAENAQVFGTIYLKDSATGGSNLSPANPLIAERAAEIISRLQPAEGELVSADLVSASGSGMDPHISVESARLQASRIASARDLSLDKVIKLIDEKTYRPSLAGFGFEPLVNVLEINLSLDSGKK